MLLEINLFSFCIYLQLLFTKDFEIHALPVNDTSRTVQACGDKKEHVHVKYTLILILPNLDLTGGKGRVLA